MLDENLIEVSEKEHTINLDHGKNTKDKGGKYK